MSRQAVLSDSSLPSPIDSDIIHLTSVQVHLYTQLNMAETRLTRTHYYSANYDSYSLYAVHTCNGKIIAFNQFEGE